MPHSQKLTELKEFKWALWGPLGAAVIVAIIITVADYLSPESLQFCLTSECFNDAIKRHKFSLGVAALVFPLVALVAAYHRSVQTAAQIKRADSQLVIANKQIDLVSSKNNFENYLKHKEMFKNALIGLDSKREGYFFDHEKLYSVIFKNNNALSFDPYVRSTDFDKSIIKNLGDIFHDINKEVENRSFNSYFLLLNSCLELDEISSEYSNKVPNSIHDVIVNGYSLSNVIARTHVMFTILIQFSSLKKVKWGTDVYNLTNVSSFDFGTLRIHDEKLNKSVKYEGLALFKKLEKEYKKSGLRLRYFDEIF